jgi:hypothetical protein
VRHPEHNTEVMSKSDPIESPDPKSAADGALKLHLPLLSGIVIPLVLASLTVFAAAWQFRVTNERSDHARFIDGAQATAQETSVLLDDGYSALDKLYSSTGSDGWKKFSGGPLKDYMEFRRRWHQQLVSEHFKLKRYFGQDLADQLVHIDEIDLHPVDNLKSQNPCTPPGDKSDFDVEKLAFQTWCTVTRIPLAQDMIDAHGTVQTSQDFITALEGRRVHEDFARKLLEQYDKTTLGYLRELDSRLTQLGQPQVTVVVTPAASK